MSKSTRTVPVREIRGPGGWGAILRWNGKEKELTGGEAETTNKTHGLMAAISALEAIKEPVTADLFYRFILRARWHRQVDVWLEENGWKTADKKPVKNAELWQRLDEANKRHKVEWHWIKAMPVTRKMNGG